MSQSAAQDKHSLKPDAAAARVGRSFLIGFPWLLFAAVICVVWYASPRGFDLLDSGCYYLEYAYPQDSADTHTSYRFFAAPLFAAVGGNIVAFRWLSWLLLWGSAVILASGLLRVLKDRAAASPPPLTRAVVLASLLHASSAMYTIKPAALTYNSFNVIAVNVALGLFFQGLATLAAGAAGKPSRGLLAIAASLGVVVFEFFIKPTTAVFLAAAIMALCVLLPEVPKQLKRRLLVFLVGAGLLASLGFVVFFGGVGPVVERVQTLLSIAKNQSYMDVLLSRTVREFSELGTFLRSDLWLPGLVLSAGGLAAAVAPRRFLGRIAAFSGVCVLVLWAYRIIDAELWKGSHQLYAFGVVARSYLSLLALAAGASFISWLVLRGWRSPRAAVMGAISWLAIFFLLAATPFAGAFGSTTTVYLNGALYASCWVAASLMLLATLAAAWKCPLVVWLPVAALSVVSVAQLFHGQVMMPYMQNRPLWEQHVPVPFGESGSVLLVDDDTAAYIEKTRAIFTENGFKKGDDIFCFFNVPGMVFALGGRSPVIPWYFGRIYVNDPVEEWYMRRAGPARVAKAWVLTQDDVTRFRDHFRKGGIAFPEGYDRLAKYKSPFTALEIGVWKPRDAVAKP